TVMLFWLGLFAVGVAAGSLGALLGLGGGIFLVPALTLFFDLPVRTAIGVSLIGVIATSAGVASVSRPGRGADTALALRLEIATTSGALVGGFAAGKLPQDALSLVFAAVVLATAIYTYLKTRRKAGPASETQIEEMFRTDYTPKRWGVGLSFSALAGALSGLSGIGGGFIKVPVMYSVMDVPLGVATATSNFMVGITAAASATLYYSRGDIRPLVAVPTALGVFAGAMLGSQLASRLRVDVLRRLLIVLLVLIGLQMTWKGITGG
ncbi:MAG: sulfite exporter TauE/SafE family protein, partial [Nitrososphaerales archaeon]